LIICIILEIKNVSILASHSGGSKDNQDGGPCT